MEVIAFYSSPCQGHEHPLDQTRDAAAHLSLSLSLMQYGTGLDTISVLVTFSISINQETS
jgi:hypothetical protein